MFLSGCETLGAGAVGLEGDCDVKEVTGKVSWPKFQVLEVIGKRLTKGTAELG